MKKTGIVLLILISALVVVYFIVDKPLPQGLETEEADELANKMLEAINHEQWTKTGAVAWTFHNRKYVWDKERHFVRVIWGEYEVLVNINNKVGVARKGGEKLEGEENADAVQKAWENWVNDSFWLNAVSKIFDPGTRRQLVDLKDSDRKGLLVTYSSGGSTPGDSYLWIPDENYLPERWRIWAKIIPVGGVEFSWSRWITTETGVKISTYHDGPFLDLNIKDVKTAYRLEEIVPGKDIFAELKEVEQTP